MLKLENAEHKLVTISQNNIPGRIAEALLFLQKHYGTDENSFIKVHFTREELSNFIGTSIETTIRTLSDFQKEKLILLEGRNIKILQEKKLDMILNGY